jgi:hypothetical protein
MTAFVRSGAVRSLATSAMCGVGAIPLAQAGWPGLRFTERLEDDGRQHLPTDHFAHVNFGYVAQVARLNLSRARAASSPARPTAPSLASRSASRSAP